MGGGGSTPAKVAAQTADKTVTINAVNLVDAHGNAYEDPILSVSKSFSAITTTGTSPVSIPENNLTNYVPPTHYGYQGNWTLAWTPGEGNTQAATLSWEQTGYIANPERQGSLVPNTLWDAFSDLRAIQNLMEVSANGANYHRGF
ncbi:chlamydia polymorphic membrane middle domain protein [Chlamydia psittaci 09DC80]|nr:chlamydia polymorphic membrane middle domain protein [Chlamydia psittaci 09DC80]